MDAMDEKLARALDNKSKMCDRGIIGAAQVGWMEHGFALVAPDCIIYARTIFPGEFFDFCLN